MASPKRPADDDADAGFIEDPDLFESDLTLGRVPIYQEEAGARPGKASGDTLHPCEACGTPILVGELDTGALVPVEPQVPTYALRWLNRESRPRLLVSRGYPAHQCRR